MLEVEEFRSKNSFASKKIITLQDAERLISELKKKNKRIGLCHGGFDLLHAGHIKHIESAKELCDVLFVSITSDKHVSKRKNTGRPVFNDKLRAYSVAALEFVDYVVIGDFINATELINQLKPSYYIKGPDFINKTTPGISAERNAIKDIGGEIKYTTDPKLSTTKIIDYIKNNIDKEKVLLVIDRDGTIIEDTDFFGKDEDWKKNIKFNKNVIDFLSYIQTKINPINIVVSNQAGVARGYFDCKRVEEINTFLDDSLQKDNIKINSWQYCPDVDLGYAIKTANDFKKEFTKKTTKRKPSKHMVNDALDELKLNLEDFNKIIVLGDRHEDEDLAKNLQAKYINVKGKTYDDLIKEFETKIK